MVVWGWRGNPGHNHQTDASQLSCIPTSLSPLTEIRPERPMTEATSVYLDA